MKSKTVQYLQTYNKLEIITVILFKKCVITLSVALMKLPSTYRYMYPAPTKMDKKNTTSYLDRPSPINIW